MVAGIVCCCSMAVPLSMPSIIRNIVNFFSIAFWSVLGVGLQVDSAAAAAAPLFGCPAPITALPLSDRASVFRGWRRWKDAGGACAALRVAGVRLGCRLVLIANVRDVAVVCVVGLVVIATFGCFSMCPTRCWESS